ncbi:hypothetical protein AVEN_163961-1 [Araneus ventricosus]|uniref:MATH domain-containing protein n=1 Tax=Araneus ventricosus TaxID=182803 RepID=A0A4Y2W6Q4_ARAVE|nr:hypothetical protein AVEN_163961-1 [Araneus ventricosus]
MYRRDSISIVQENLKDLWDSDVGVKKHESFGIVWRITNFTMCKLEKGEFFESPIFVAESLQNTNWYLRLYPRGERDCDDIVCYLHRGNSSPDSITVRYKLSVGISNQCADQVQTFEMYSQSAVPAYARRDEVLDEVRKYPLVDVLLVDCRLWNCQTKQRKGSIFDVKSLISYLHNYEYNADNLPQEVLHSTMDEVETLKRKLRPYPESCSAYTRIPVERWYFLWSIKRFSERQSNEKEAITVISVSESAPKILVTFFVDEEGDLEMDIRELTGKYGSSFTANFKIQLVGIHERNFEIRQDMHLFSSNEIWKIPLHISQTDIVRQEDRFLLDDRLTFRCELAISYENEVSNIDSCSYVSDDSKPILERQISYGQSIVHSNSMNSAWTHMKFVSFICFISFLLVFIYDALA